jgi:PAS domain S-box-containing protein
MRTAKRNTPEGAPFSIDRPHKEALLDAGALQSAIFNSANFSSIATDAKGVIQIFNVGAERMLGYTAAEVLNKITPADISDPQEVIARAKALSVELGTPITPGFEALVFKASRGIEDIYELTYIRKDRSRFPAVVSVTALRDAQDAIIGYLLIGTDNTARKQVEEERQKLDQRLRDQHFYTRSLIESNIDALMTTDPRGIITDVNKQMEALTGCTRDELIGAPFKDYFTDSGRAQAGINRVLAEGKVTNYELTARARDGTLTVVSYNATTFHDRGRRLQGVFAAARDVTELKSVNAELDRRTREIASAQVIADAATARLARLQSITAALSNTVTQDEVADSVLREAIVALECDAGVVVVAPAEEGTGLTLLHESGSLDPLMRSFKQMQPSRSRGPYAEAVEKCGPIYLESFEEMLARYPAFRSVSKVESRGAWIFLPLEIGGSAVGALAFGFAGPRKFTLLDRHFADTVSRYCAQALDRVRLRIAAAAALAEASDARMMAEHANHAKTAFLRAMSHELRTPLNAISGYTEILELGIRGVVNPEQTEDLGRIKRAAAYLLRLINDVLTIARLEGARPLHLISIPVNAVLAEVEGLCALQAKAKGITLTVAQCEREVLVAADAERFQQILLNLITNAIKFTTTGGSIGVTCDCDASMVRVRVKDTGVGVRLLDLDRVFEPFVQIDRHLTTTSLQGVGLGLSISRELARAMHGDLTLQSTERVGSTFTLTLPIASETSLAPSIVTPALPIDNSPPSSRRSLPRSSAGPAPAFPLTEDTRRSRPVA